MAQHVMITGGSSGIGKATACLYAARGCDVSILARRQDVIDAAIVEIDAARGGAGGRTIGCTADVSDAALQADMAGWLGPWLGGRLRLAQLAELDLVACLQGLLDWQQQQQLDAWLPSHYTSPAGSRRRIDYLAEGPPRCAVPLQEVFGEADTPTLAGGRLPLVLELLNPAGRPIQVTADLANFWAGAYTEVRKELRGRYPKHDWPEDPAAATARRGTGRRRRG